MPLLLALATLTDKLTQAWLQVLGSHEGGGHSKRAWRVERQLPTAGMRWPELTADFHADFQLEAVDLASPFLQKRVTCGKLSAVEPYEGP